ncbi:MAG: alginate lyase family protein [Bacteroidales bacterium]|nr:alginate lyase family protein [Bacteroidales bacterium]
MLQILSSFTLMISTMINTKWIRILLFTLGLICIDNLIAGNINRTDHQHGIKEDNSVPIAGVVREASPEIVRALSDVEKLLPDEVKNPRSLISALSGFASRPSPADGEKIIAMVTEQLGDMEAAGEFMATAGIIAMAGVMLDDQSVSWLWRLVGWSRMAKQMDQNDPLHQALLTMTVEAALAKGLPIVPEAAAWYSDSKKIMMAPPALTIHMTDWDFLNRLKSVHPGLKDVIAARDGGDLVSAKKAYAAYLRETKTLSDDAMFLRTEHEDWIEQADELMDNIWTISTHMNIKHNFGPVVGVYNEILNDLESLVDINKHLQLANLARVYRGTENPKYLDKLIELWMSWYHQSPVPNTGQIGRAGPWRTLEAGSRSWRAWPEVMMAMLEGDTEDEVLFTFAKRYLEQGIYLATHRRMVASNWYQVESAGLATVGALFPEVDICDYLYDIGTRRVLWTADNSFLPDGFQIEVSPGYHGYPFSSLALFCIIARDMGRDIPAKLFEIFNRAADVFVYMTQPDLILPPLQDQGSAPKSTAEGLGLALSFHENPTWRFIVSQFSGGEPPEYTSYALPWAGYYIMREAWSPDSRYLVFDGGFYGAGHQHEDKLHFLLHAHGRSMITDPGIYSYRRDPYERYFRSVRAHNSIIVDGKEQYRYHLRKPRPDGPDPDARWEANDLFAFVSGAYNDGFTEVGPGSRNCDTASTEMDIIHRRSIFHPRDGFYLIGDLVSDAQKEKERSLEQIFQLAPIVENVEEGGVRPVKLVLDEKSGLARTEETGYANLMMLPVGPDLPEESGVYLGQTEPDVRGWVTLYGRNPAHDLVYKYNSKLPVKMNTLIFTAPEGEELSPRIKTAEADEGKGFSIVIEDKGITHHLLISDEGPQKMRMGEFEGWGEILWVKSNADGDALAGGTVNGTYISWSGQTLAKAENPGYLTWSKP